MDLDTKDGSAVVEDAPIIPFVDIEALDSEAREVLDHTINVMGGRIANSMRVYLHRGDIGRLISDMNDTINASPRSTLDPSLKPKLGVICSSTNGCAYCTSHQCGLDQSPAAQAGRWSPQAGEVTTGLSDEQILALISGEDKGADEIERICFEYARVASENPGGVSDDLLRRMTAVLTPAQIVEVACVVGFWKFVNTVHDSLHIPKEAHLSKYWGVIEAGRARASGG